jgi:hypothetical protein
MSVLEMERLNGKKQLYRQLLWNYREFRSVYELLVMHGETFSHMYVVFV